MHDSDCDSWIQHYKFHDEILQVINIVFSSVCMTVTYWYFPAFLANQFIMGYHNTNVTFICFGITIDCFIQFHEINLKATLWLH